MKQSQIREFEAQIWSHFKKSYLDSLSREKIPTANELLEGVLFTLGIQDFQQEELLGFLSWHENIDQLNFLKKFTRDENLHEIILHGPSKIQTISSGQQNVFNSSVLDPDDFQLALEVLALKNKVSWSYAQPFSSFYFFDGEFKWRASLSHHCLSPNQYSKLFLRKISNAHHPLSSFCCNEETSNLMENVVYNKKNIIIAGPTGSGKTSLARTLLQEIPQDEHLIILEDTHEIIHHHPCTTHLLSNGENDEEKSLNKLLANALRMRPDRLVLGEIRSKEVAPFLLAMNTGHRGLISTIHANSAVDTLNRLATLFCLYNAHQDLNFERVLSLVCQNIDHVIFIENRKIKEVISVLGCNGKVPFYEKIELF